jgi:hypothetical protein
MFETMGVHYEGQGEPCPRGRPILALKSMFYWETNVMFDIGKGVLIEALVHTNPQKNR